MHEYRLPIGEFPQSSREVKRVEPAFKIGEVSYYDRLPAEPIEKPRQTLLPLSDVGDWAKDYIAQWNETHPPEKHKKIGWSGNESGIRDPKFGSVEHYATVEYDNEGNLIKLVDDTVLYQDGPLDPRTGIATPGSVVAPIEKRDDGYYVHCFWQWRPALWTGQVEVPAELTDRRDIEHFKALHTGEWVLSLPGGYARQVSALFAETAEVEAKEEAGLKIDKPAFTHHSFNRARMATMVGVGYSSFERVDDEVHEGGEIFFGRMAVRIDKFRSPDAMAMAAVNFAREDLGLIGSGK